MLKLYRAHHGIVFICGALHVPALMSFFKKNNIQDDIIYYFPQTSAQFEHGIDDIAELKQQEQEHKFFILKSEDDIQSFAKQIIYEVKEKMENKSELHNKMRL